MPCAYASMRALHAAWEAAPVARAAPNCATRCLGDEEGRLRRPAQVRLGLCGVGDPERGTVRLETVLLGRTEPRWVRTLISVGRAVSARAETIAASIALTSLPSATSTVCQP